MRLIPQQAPADIFPDRFDLGKTDAEILLNTPNDNRNAAISLARQCFYSVNIYTQDLEPQVLNNEEFAKCLLDLARHHRQMKIRILVRDSSKAVRGSHVLLKMAQQLSSHIEVRNIPDVYNDNKAAFLVADRAGFYYRVKAHEYEGSVNFNSPRRAVKLLEYFTQVWELSVPDPHFRKLHI